MEKLGIFCWVLIFPFLICTLRIDCENSNPRVTTGLGELVGRFVQVEDTVANQSLTVKEFLGVPYAKPPLGNLRFQKPQPVEAWRHSLMCHSMPNACMQFMKYPLPWTTFVRGHTGEDCLYMNIWVPIDASKENKKSVFFWIYGGGFFSGSARQPIYQGQVMAALGDVIVVVINYRLGSLGFWTNNATDAPGNAGVWDTIEALKWVNKYIEEFGGDKDSITIAGESAGGVMVSLLAIAKEVKGLYKRQIVQSATAMWSLMDDPFANSKQSQTVSESVGCANDSFRILDHPEEVAECMKGIDATTLIQEEAKLNPVQPSSFLPMWGEELFPRLPREVLLEGHYPFSQLFIGDSGHEGANMITISDESQFGLYGEKDPKYDRDAAKQLIFQNFPWDEEQERVVDQYLPEMNPDGGENIDWRLKASDSVGDFVIECPTVYYAAVAGETGTDVYFYDFQHRPSNSPWAKWMQTTHFDEVDFVFGGPIRNLSAPMEEKRLSKMMITHWTNFVKHGKPTDDWPLYSEKAETRVYNGSGDPTTGFEPHGSNCRFWKDIINPNQTFELPAP